MITRTAPGWQTGNWKIQLSQAITSVEKLLSMLELNPGLLPAGLQAAESFKLRVPMPYAAKIEKGNYNDPLLRQILPVEDELNIAPGFTRDPLGEQDANALPGVLHKYKSRILLISGSACAINCRYCFRRHFPYEENGFSRQDMENILSYLIKHPEINEVILSGGDPLMNSNQRLSQLLTPLDQLPQIKRLRIHSRLPVVIPERIDQGFLDAVFRLQNPLVLVTHVNHPRELDQQFDHAMKLLRQNGIHLLNQTVLLKGVNDDNHTLVALSERLFAAGVLPYYLHILDHVQGASHFLVPKERAVNLYKQLLEELPGFLVPKLVQEVAGMRSKTPVHL